jgi:hypothetical protein
MSIITTQQLAKYYEHYKGTDVTFNKEVIAATGLVTRNVYLKVQDRQVACMVFSSSMSAAKVIATVPAVVMGTLKQANNRLSLRWCFKLPDKVEPITFFVTCHPTAFTHYALQGPDVHFITLEFTQRPPDDLIQILGTLLDASSNAQRRKDERVLVTPETMKKLGLESREASLAVGPAVHKCVLRDLSFSGAKVVVQGPAAAFTGKSAVLRIARGDQGPEIQVPGSVRRAEEVGGRKEILAVSIEFSGDPPMTYKLLINSYVSSSRKTALEGQKPAAAPSAAPSAPAAPKPAPQPPAKSIEQIADEAAAGVEGPEDPAAGGAGSPSGSTR